MNRDLAVLWLSASESGSIARTLDAVAAFLRHVVLPDRRTALWVAAWALATWCYRAFRVFPYLWIRSVEKRYGEAAPKPPPARLLQRLAGHRASDGGIALPLGRAHRPRARRA